MWKDTTSYSRDDKDRVPRVLTLVLSRDFEAIIHRLHGVPDTWFLSLKYDYKFLIKDLQLQSRDQDAVGMEAADVARAFLSDLSLSIATAHKVLARC
jgi:hypothetical protein